MRIVRSHLGRSPGSRQPTHAHSCRFGAELGACRGEEAKRWQSAVVDPIAIAIHLVASVKTYHAAQAGPCAVGELRSYIHIAADMRRDGAGNLLPSVCVAEWDTTYTLVPHGEGIQQYHRALHLAVRLQRWSRSPFSEVLRRWNSVVARLWMAWASYNMGVSHPPGRMSAELLASLRQLASRPSLRPGPAASLSSR